MRVRELQSRHFNFQSIKMLKESRLLCVGAAANIHWSMLMQTVRILPKRGARDALAELVQVGFHLLERSAKFVYMVWMFQGPSIT